MIIARTEITTINPSQEVAIEPIIEVILPPTEVIVPELVVYVAAAAEVIFSKLTTPTPIIIPTIIRINTNWYSCLSSILNQDKKNARGT